MKKCTHCGKEHPDEAVACAIDQEPLVACVPATVAATDLNPEGKPRSTSGTNPEANISFIQNGRFRPLLAVLAVLAALFVINLLKEAERKAEAPIREAVESQAAERRYALDRQRESDRKAELEEERRRIVHEDSPFAVKGFHMGMTIVAKGLLEAYNLTNRQDRTIGSSHLIGHEGEAIREIVASGDLHNPAGERLQNRIYGQIALGFDNDELVAPEMTERTVNCLFNVSDLAPREFAQQFIDNYGLPEMTPTVSHDVSALSYRDTTNGFEVAIYNGKCLCFRKIPKANEPKFD